MTTNAADQPSPLRWLAALLLLIGAFLAVNTAINRSDYAQGVSHALIEDPRVEVRAAIDDIAKASERGRPTAGQVQRAVIVSRSAPLLPEPFLVAGIAANEAGRADLGESLLLAARSRNPRLPVVRYTLGDHYRRTGQDEKALRELVALSKLQPQRQLVLLPYFARLAAEPVHRNAIRRIILADPGFGRQLLAAAVEEGAAPSQVLFVAQGLPSHPENRIWQDQLVQSAFNRGDMAEARAIWDKLADPGARRSYLVNPDFSGIGPPVPFNWVFSAGAEGVAEPLPGGQLSLLYFGRNPVGMASQVLMLPPGRFRMEWQPQATSGDVDALSWRISCLPAGGIAGQAPLSARQLSFAIPSPCQFQRLELAAQPVNGGSRVSMRLSDLRLERLP